MKKHYRIKRNAWSYDYKYDETPLHFAAFNDHLVPLNFHQSQSLRST